MLKRISRLLGVCVEKTKRDGFVAFCKKVLMLCGRSLLSILVVPLVIVMRLLRPFIIVRLAEIDINRIGNIIYADWYLSGCYADGTGKRHFDIFYFSSSMGLICNRQWLRMWKRVLRVFPFGKFAGTVDRVQKKILDDGVHSVPMISVVSFHDEAADKNNDKLRCVLEHKKPNIFLTRKEEILGQKACRDLGIPAENPFVCFHSRDSAYLNTVYPARDWSYHDYRDSSILNYISSAEELVRRGYYTVRMGSIVKEKLPATHSAIIDYSTNGKRSEFLDIYLGAKCEFFICSDTGIAIIPEMFRRPIVYVNWCPIARITPWVLNGLFIFKKFYLQKEQRFLTFPEVMNLRFEGIETKDLFCQKGIELIENTPEEIRAVTIEMDERLKDRWKTTEEDEELQQRFWALFGPHKLKNPGLRIGADFLRQNQELMS